MYQNGKSSGTQSTARLSSDARHPFSAIGSWTASTASYLSAGRLLHAITVLKLSLILVIIAVAAPNLLRVPLVTALVMLAVLTQLDARSRFQEFKKVRDQLIRYGPDKRFFQALSRSRCQRDAVLAAARQLGHGSVCLNHFTTAGYRWYHLLPDYAGHYPRFLCSPAFLKATFFAPTYHSRYTEPVAQVRFPAAPGCQITVDLKVPAALPLIEHISKIV